MGALAAPRLLQGRQGSLEAEAAIQVLLPLHGEIGEQQPQPLHQKTGAALLSRSALAWPGDDKLLGGPGAGEVDGGHLTVKKVPGGLVQLQAIGRQQGAVVVRQQPRRGGHLRDGGIVRPQQKLNLAVLAGLAGGLPRGHPVQGDGDGTHVVLGQHQPEQGGKLLQLHGGLPQQLGTLLQAAADDLPQLAVLLGQGGLLPLPQGSHPLLQPLRKADILQKTVKGYGLTLSGLIGILSQKLQRLGHLAAGTVQPLQQGLVFLCHGEAVAPGVHIPGFCLGPAAPPQVPFENVVFQ